MGAWASRSFTLKCASPCGPECSSPSTVRWAKSTFWQSRPSTATATSYCFCTMSMKACRRTFVIPVAFCSCSEASRYCTWKKNCRNMFTLTWPSTYCSLQLAAVRLRCMSSQARMMVSKLTRWSSGLGEAVPCCILEATTASLYTALASLHSHSRSGHFSRYTLCLL